MATTRKKLRRQNSWQRLIEWSLLAFAVLGSSRLNAVYPYLAPASKASIEQNLSDDHFRTTAEGFESSEAVSHELQGRHH